MMTVNGMNQLRFFTHENENGVDQFITGLDLFHQGYEVHSSDVRFNINLTSDANNSEVTLNEAPIVDLQTYPLDVSVTTLPFNEVLYGMIPVHQIQSSDLGSAYTDDLRDNILDAVYQISDNDGNDILHSDGSGKYVYAVLQSTQGSSDVLDLTEAQVTFVVVDFDSSSGLHALVEYELEVGEYHFHSSKIYSFLQARRFGLAIGGGVERIKLDGSASMSEVVELLDEATRRQKTLYLTTTDSLEVTQVALVIGETDEDVKLYDSSTGIALASQPTVYYHSEFGGAIDMDYTKSKYATSEQNGVVGISHNGVQAIPFLDADIGKVSIGGTDTDTILINVPSGQLLIGDIMIVDYIPIDE